VDRDGDLTNPVARRRYRNNATTATASDDIGVVSVEFLVDGVFSDYPASAHLTKASWNTAGAEGLHNRQAGRARCRGTQDTAERGRHGGERLRGTTLVADQSVNGSTVSSTVTLSAAVTDDVSVTSVEFLV